MINTNEKISASRGFEKFDENIIFNILKRIEADTLYNLRVVCKQWYNLILDPHFVTTNLSYAQPGIMVQILVNCSYRLSFVGMKGGEVEFRDLNICLEMPVIASCNGLVLVTKHGDVSVTNLLTRKAIEVPPSRSDREKCFRYAEKFFGFTYIPETREYKIVCQMFDRSISSSVVKILTLGFDEWRQIKGPKLHLDSSEVSITINRFVHSLALKPNRDFLFTIDTANETSHMTKLPYYKPTDDIYLMDLGGVLSFVSCSDDHVEVWVLEDLYKKEWIGRHCINYKFKMFDRILPKDIVPIGSLGNGRVILFVERRMEFHRYCYAVDVELKQVNRLDWVKHNRRHCIQHYLNSLISSESLRNPTML